MSTERGNDFKLLSLADGNSMCPFVVSIANQDQNYWFNDRNFVPRGCFDQILRFRRTAGPAILRVNVLDLKST